MASEPRRPPAKPLKLPRQLVEQQWIDYNGHMNVAYYVLAFDHALDHFFDELGIGSRAIENHGVSIFVVESHIRYLNEVAANETLDIELQLVDVDRKCLHYFMQMKRGRDKKVAATIQQLALCVDMKTRKTAFIPSTVLNIAEPIRQAHKRLERPAGLCSQMGIRRKT